MARTESGLGLVGGDATTALLLLRVHALVGDARGFLGAARFGFATALGHYRDGQEQLGQLLTGVFQVVRLVASQLAGDLDASLAVQARPSTGAEPLFELDTQRG